MTLCWSWPEFSSTVGAAPRAAATTVSPPGHSRASIVATLEPVLATVVAWLWLGETFGTAQLVGGAVVLAGIFLAQTAR